jgi:hypothetical protein
MILGLQDSRRERLELTVIAKDYVAEGLLKCDEKYFILEDGSFNFPNDEWRGSWLESAIVFTDTAVTPTNTDSNPGGFGADTGDEPPPPPIITGQAEQGGIVPGAIPPGLAINTNTDADATAGVEIDTITIGDNPTDVPLFAGDVLNITNPITGQQQQVVVAYDSNLGIPGLETDPGAFPYYGQDGLVWLVPSTTQVAIVPVTPTVDLPAGSYVQPNSQFESQLQAVLRTAHVDANIFGYEDTVTTGFAGWFWRPGTRLGWHIKNVHFAFGQDLGATTKVNLKYYDASGFRYTIATHNTTGLGTIQPAFATVQSGYYLVEVETITGTAPKGLQVIIELIKIKS